MFEWVKYSCCIWVYRVHDFKFKSEWKEKTDLVDDDEMDTGEVNKSPDTQKNILKVSISFFRHEEYLHFPTRFDSPLDWKWNAHNSAFAYYGESKTFSQFWIFRGNKILFVKSLNSARNKYQKTFTQKAFLNCSFKRKVIHLSYAELASSGM